MELNQALEQLQENMKEAINKSYLALVQEVNVSLNKIVNTTITNAETIENSICKEVDDVKASFKSILYSSLHANDKVEDTTVETKEEKSWNTENDIKINIKQEVDLESIPTEVTNISGEMKEKSNKNGKTFKIGGNKTDKSSSAFGPIVSLPMNTTLQSVEGKEIKKVSHKINKEVPKDTISEPRTIVPVVDDERQQQKKSNDIEPLSSVEKQDTDIIINDDESRSKTLTNKQAIEFLTKQPIEPLKCVKQVFKTKTAPVIHSKDVQNGNTTSNLNETSNDEVTHQESSIQDVKKLEVVVKRLEVVEEAKKPRDKVLRSTSDSNKTVNRTNENLKCVICQSKVTQNKEDAVKHCQTHTGAHFDGTNLIDQIPCLLCKEEFQTVTELKSHIDDVHETSFVFKLTTDKTDSKDQSPGEVKINTTEKKEYLSCQLCPMKYITKQNLLRHINKEHDKAEDKEQSKESFTKSEQQSSKPKQPYQTIIFGKNGIKKVEFHDKNSNNNESKHIKETAQKQPDGIRITSISKNAAESVKTKANFRPPECIICNQKISPREEDVFKHSKTHTGATYNGTTLVDQIPCMVCEDIFEAQDALRTHIKEKHGAIIQSQKQDSSKSHLPSKTQIPSYKRKLSDSHLKPKHSKISIAKEDEVTITKRPLESTPENKAKVEHYKIPSHFPSTLKILKVPSNL